jgi:hypothetical protein
MLSVIVAGDTNQQRGIGDLFCFASDNHCTFEHAADEATCAGVVGDKTRGRHRFAVATNHGIANLSAQVACGSETFIPTAGHTTAI